MAFQMNFTEPNTKTPHPESYWRVGLEAMDVNEFAATLLFSGFHEAANASPDPQTLKPTASPIADGGGKSYTLTDAQKIEAMTIAKAGRDGQGNPTTLYAFFYAMAKDTLDVPTGNTNADGTPKMVSFFADAQDV